VNDVESRFLCFGALLAVPFVIAAGPVDGRVCGEGPRPPLDYVPPMIANGDVCLILDWTLGARVKPAGGDISTGVFRAARRVSHPRRELFRQGTLNACVEIDGRTCDYPLRWSQKLDIECAAIGVNNVYTGDVRVVGEAFVPDGHPVVAVRLKATNGAQTARRVRLGVDFAAPHHERIRFAWGAPEPGAGRLSFDYTSFGYHVTDGRTTVLAADGRSADCSFSPKGVGTVSRLAELVPGASCETAFFVVFSDSLENKLEDAHTPVNERHAARVSELVKLGYDGVRHRHEKAWTDFYGESSVRLPDSDIQRLWDMANYHLKCVATRWSFPTGIFDSHWQGNFFAWDELFCQQGLLAAGHIDLASRATAFRHRILGNARKRTSCWHEPTPFGARYWWETMEDGTSEGTTPGFWMDHVFQMATVARGAWMQYLYSGDRDFLRTKGYPVMLACARFFRTQTVYEDSRDGSAFIGWCCDLERLGQAIDHPFLTTCGAIGTMRWTAEAAKILGCETGETRDLVACAARLERGLPHKDGRYIACLNPRRPKEQVSVATIGGAYPFPIFGADNALQRKAAEHFFAHGKSSGNMYQLGKGFCSWYAAWLGSAMVVFDMYDDIHRCLGLAAKARGLFGEFIEINEPEVSVVRHPWFSSAAGNCQYLIAQLLVRTRGEATEIGAGVPSGWREWAIRLPTPRGEWVTATVREGRLASFAVRSNATGPAGLTTFSFPSRLFAEEAFDQAAVRRVMHEKDRVLVDLVVK